MNNASVFYDIYILHSEHEQLNCEELDKLPTYYSNCSITYRSVGNIFDSAFEIRGITTPAYYRLLIPELIPEYDKVIYSDVDVIFRMDLSELYSLDLKENYLAATKDLGLNLSKDGVAYIQSMPELHLGDYLQSGFIVINNKKILIVGSTGTIGSFLVDTLMRRNQLYNENITIYLYFCCQFYLPP